MGVLVTSPDPQDIIQLFVAPRFDEHMKAYRWHKYMLAVQPDYLDEIARRQAYKRSIGK